MIKNIVFDMGNVLVRFDPELFMDRYSLTGEDRRLIRNEVFRSVEWTMLDRGVIDEEIGRTAHSAPPAGASARCSPWADRKVG